MHADPAADRSVRSAGASLRIDLHAAGVLAPGIRSLAELLALSRGATIDTAASTDWPEPNALPANERRRASHVVRLSLACAEQALEGSRFAPDDLRLVFASDEGTGEVCQKLLEALATTREVSPLLFHNSVHNAPSGYFSIAYRNRRSATSLSLGEQSFACGLLCAASEAVATGEPVLLLAYDAAMPAPMNTLLPIVHSTACAWIVTGHRPPSGGPAIGTFELSLEPPATAEPEPLPAWLPAAWAANSSARGLATLGLLAGDAARKSCGLALGRQLLRVERVSEAAC